MLFHSLSDTLVVLLFALLLAMGLDGLAALLPPLGRVWGAPGRWMAKFLGWLRGKLNRANRGDAVLRARGVILTLTLLALAIVSGLAATKLAAQGQGGIVVEIVVLARLLSAAPLLACARRLRRLLQADTQVQTMEELVRPVVRRDALMVDQYAVTRAMIEAVAEATNAALFAPVIAYLTFGLPGAFALRLFALQAWRWRGAEGPRGFSASARSVWTGMARFPAMLAAPGIALAAAISPGAKGLAALGQWWLNLAKPTLILATFGGALNVSLGGPRTNLPDNPWCGGASARPTPQTLRIGLRLYWLVRGLALVALCLAWSRIAA